MNAQGLLSPWCRRTTVPFVGAEYSVARFAREFVGGSAAAQPLHCRLSMKSAIASHKRLALSLCSVSLLAACAASAGDAESNQQKSVGARVDEVFSLVPTDELPSPVLWRSLPESITTSDAWLDHRQPLSDEAKSKLLEQRIEVTRNQTPKTYAHLEALAARVWNAARGTFQDTAPNLASLPPPAIVLVDDHPRQTSVTTLWIPPREATQDSHIGRVVWAILFNVRWLANEEDFEDDDDASLGWTIGHELSHLLFQHGPLGAIQASGEFRASRVPSDRRYSDLALADFSAYQFFKLVSGTGKRYYSVWNSSFAVRLVDRATRAELCSGASPDLVQQAEEFTDLLATYPVPTVDKRLMFAKAEYSNAHTENQHSFDVTNVPPSSTTPNDSHGRHTKPIMVDPYPGFAAKLVDCVPNRSAIGKLAESLGDLVGPARWRQELRQAVTRGGENLHAMLVQLEGATTRAVSELEEKPARLISREDQADNYGALYNWLAGGSVERSIGVHGCARDDSEGLRHLPLTPAEVDVLGRFPAGFTRTQDTPSLSDEAKSLHGYGYDVAFHPKPCFRERVIRQIEREIARSSRRPSHYTPLPQTEAQRQSGGQYWFGRAELNRMILELRERFPVQKEVTDHSTPEPAPFVPDGSGD